MSDKTKSLKIFGAFQVLHGFAEHFADHATQPNGAFREELHVQGLDGATWFEIIFEEGTDYPFFEEWGAWLHDLAAGYERKVARFHAQDPEPGEGHPLYSAMALAQVYAAYGEAEWLKKNLVRNLREVFGDTTTLNIHVQGYRE